MENVRKRIKVNLCNTERQFKRQIAKPTYGKFKIFNEDLVGVHLQISNLVLNKPIYVKMTILDLSKTLMYEFDYRYIRNKYAKANLLFTEQTAYATMYKPRISTRIYKQTPHTSTPVTTLPTISYILQSTRMVLGKMKDETLVWQYPSL